MPKESPPGPALRFMDLKGVAKEGARLWPKLAPLGGTGWTREDIGWAVSSLYVESRTERVARAASKAKSKEQVQNYLLKALRNQLLKRAERGRRVVLLDSMELDFLRPSDPRRKRLDREDRRTLVARVLRQLTEREQLVAADVLRGRGDSAEASADRQRCLPPRRTRTRHRARFMKVIQTVVMEAGLNRSETVDLLAALGARLAKPNRS